VKHVCHAVGCQVEILPKFHMCLKHWEMVPRGLQKEVWINYRKGQEDTKIVSLNYIEAVRKSVSAVYNKEKK